MSATDLHAGNPSKPNQRITIALVVAAGRGLRASGAVDDVPKQYRSIGGVAVLRRTVTALLAAARIDAVCVVINPASRTAYDAAMSGLVDDPRLMPPVAGGSTRQASVLAGLEALAPIAPRFVLIHDAARPFVTTAVVDDALARLEAGATALVAAVPVADTLKRSRDGKMVEATVARDGLWSAQTPQSFVFSEILKAHRAAAQAGRLDFTDDAAVAEWAGLSCGLSAGDPGNIKITTVADLAAADRRLTMEEAAKPQDVRVGTGYDVHAFAPGTAVVLGGLSIDHDRGLKGHSDADVVLHALTDALLGALAEGDIGQHFPPSDPRWKGAASDRFLQFAVDRVRARGGRIAHLDVTVVCEAPKIGPHRAAMRGSIAEICGLSVDRVSVKATTSERLGFTGRKEGIAALATATVALPFEQGEMTP